MKSTLTESNGGLGGRPFDCDGGGRGTKSILKIAVTPYTNHGSLQKW